MQEEMVATVIIILRLCDDIHDRGIGINDWRAGDANLGRKILIWTVIRVGVPSNSANVLTGHRSPQVYLPQGRHLGRTVGIKRVHTVVLSSDVNYISNGSLNIQIRQI